MLLSRTLEAPKGVAMSVLFKTRVTEDRNKAFLLLTAFLITPALFYLDQRVEKESFFPMLATSALCIAMALRSWKEPSLGLPAKAF